MALAIFDLDNTLLNGDSDHAWGEFLVDQGIVNAEDYKQKNQKFYQQYVNGSLNIIEFLDFSLKPLAENSPDTLKTLHNTFMDTIIEPMRSPGAEELIAHHRMKGDFTLIISATNLFIISPIAKLLNVDDCLGTILEKEGDQFTGKIIGEPCFQDGKLLHLNTWLSQHPELSLTDSYFYSDSINDLPMLEYVDHPRAVNADQQLLEIAKQREWPIYNFY